MPLDWVHGIRQWREGAGFCRQGFGIDSLPSGLLQVTDEILCTHFVEYGRVRPYFRLHNKYMPFAT